MKRITFLDSIKGYAIFLIVLGHTYYYTGNMSPYIEALTHCVQIPLFMFVSGLLANKTITKESFNNLIKKKSIRLLLPFLSIGTLWILFQDYPITEFLFNEFKLGYWFTYVLFEIFTLCYVIHYIAKKVQLNVYALYIMFYMCFTILLKTNTLPSSITGLLSLNLLWHYIPFFILGIFCNKKFQIFNRIISHNYMIYISLLFYIIGAILCFHYKKSLGLIIANFGGLFFFYTLFSRNLIPTKVMKILSLWGKHSLEIYLLQYFPVVLLKNTLITNYNGIILFFINLILCFVIIYMCIGFAKVIFKFKYLSFILFGTKHNKKIY